MATVLSACGVLCSGCAAYGGKAKGALYQERAAAARKPPSASPGARGHDAGPARAAAPSGSRGPGPGSGPTKEVAA